MNDTVTTPPSTCGPVDQKPGTADGIRFENGIPMFDGPAADLMRRQRVRGLLRRIGAPADCARLYRECAFPDPTAMFDLGCEWITAQWIPEFDVLDEPWPRLRRPATGPRRDDGIDAEWLASRLWRDYLSNVRGDVDLSWLYGPVPGIMGMEADDAFDAMDCVGMLGKGPFPVPAPGDAYVQEARRAVREMLPLLRGRVTDAEWYEMLLRASAMHVGLMADAARLHTTLEAAWDGDASPERLAEAAHVDFIVDMGMGIIPDADPDALRGEVMSMLPGLRRLLIGPDERISCIVFLALRWWVRRKADAALDRRVNSGRA